MIWMDYAEADAVYQQVIAQLTVLSGLLLQVSLALSVLRLQ